MTDSAKAPSKGAMRAANDLIGAGSTKLYIHAQVFKGWAEAHDIAGIIDRETKAPQMAELLRLWLHNYNANLGVIGEMQAATERLLTELEASC